MSVLALVIATFIWSLARRLMVLVLAFGLVVPGPAALTQTMAAALGRSDSLSGERAASATKITGASPAESALIRRALASETFVVDPRVFSIVVADDLSVEGAGGLYEWPESVITLERSAFSGLPITELARILSHELGHVVDRVYLTPELRASFLQQRGFPAGMDWESASLSWRNRPAEDFAEVFDNLMQPLSIAMVATAGGPIGDRTALTSLIDSARPKEVLPMVRIPSAWQHTVLVLAGSIAMWTSDPVAHLLLVLCLALAALSAFRRSSHRAMSAGRRQRRRVLALRAAL